MSSPNVRKGRRSSPCSSAAQRRNKIAHNVNAYFSSPAVCSGDVQYTNEAVGFDSTSHWAGGAHMNSPAPNCLPQPDFEEDDFDSMFPKVEVAAETAEQMSLDLRRILRMEC